MTEQVHHRSWRRPPWRGDGRGQRHGDARAWWRPLLRTGLLAGAAVGLVDTAWTVFRGVGGLSASKSVLLVLLGASWAALAGGAVALVGGATLRLIEAPRERSRLGTSRGRRGGRRTGRSPTSPSRRSRDGARRPSRGDPSSRSGRPWQAPRRCSGWPGRTRPRWPRHRTEVKERDRQPGEPWPAGSWARPDWRSAPSSRTSWSCRASIPGSMRRSRP